MIPGGVDSPVRAFGTVGGIPRFAARGEGAYLVDADGNRYVDLVQSWGAPLLFGHARAEIVKAAIEAAERGTTFGIPTELEVELAERIASAMPADHGRYARFFHHMLDRGTYLPPSGYELWTLSTGHGPAEVERILDSAAEFEG